MKRLFNELKEKWPLAVLGGLFGLAIAILIWWNTDFRTPNPLLRYPKAHWTAPKGAINTRYLIVCAACMGIIRQARAKHIKWRRQPQHRRHNLQSKCSAKIFSAMAKKAGKLPRGERYREIMAKEGITDYKILSFIFDSELRPQTFHLCLMMAEPRPEYYLFDCFGNVGQLIVPNDEKLCEQITGIAKKWGGKKATPNLL